MWQICIDTGGTFTDCLALSPEGETKRLKILSSSYLRGSIIKQLDPITFKASFHWNIDTDIFRDFEFQILGSHHTAKIAKVDMESRQITLQHPLDLIEDVAGAEFQITTREEVPILAARLLTLTPLEKKLPPIDMRLGSTRGTNALLERKGAEVILLVTKGFKDLMLIGNQQRPDLFTLNITKPQPLYKQVIEVSERIDAKGSVLIDLSDQELENSLQKLSEASKEASIAIALMNSYKNPVHEQKLQAMLHANGYQYISCSSSLASSIKILPRAETAVANAYLLPIISSYIQGIEAHIHQGQLRVMTSAGAVVGSRLFTPKDSLLSGPAGGIVGARSVAAKSGFDRLLTFDMGGTSTDVAVYNQSYDYRYETKVGDAHILSPCFSIETIAAGGGSICGISQGRLTVGPESAGAAPGPACYNAGGPLTITDINLLCGRLVEKNFSIPLSKSRSKEALEMIAHHLSGKASEKDHTPLLRSFLSIANEKMAEAIRKVSVRKGYKPEEYTLVTFGGAGGQHACAIAELLTIKTILIPYDAGLLSAYGISRADIEAFAEKQVLSKLNPAISKVTAWWEELKQNATDELERQGFNKDRIYVKRKLAYLRYSGQENTVEIEVNDQTNYFEDFKTSYKNVYGHWLEGQTIEIESLKLIAAVKSTKEPESHASASGYHPQPMGTQECLDSEGWNKTNIYSWERLQAGAEIMGPAIVVSENCTVFIERHWRFHLDDHNNGILESTAEKAAPGKLEATEAANIELFKNRFASVVEEMGALLQRTSFSVNVKERLDFSCALLDVQGELIVNAPHIPVHLGSMGICVRKVLQHIKIAEGDIVITNHPAYGGSHLPDITLISAVYDQGELLGYVANRAHHSEIGGKTPGSMPTDATSLEEEGVIIEPQYLAHQNAFFWNKMEELLGHSKYPSRAVSENLADLKGGVAALQAGIQGMKKLSLLYSAKEVKRYMQLLKSYVNDKLWQRVSTHQGHHYTAIEHLDDGHRLQVAIHFAKNKAVFDFTGTDKVHPGNLNATEAIVNSVVLYVLRLLIHEDLPLNEGLLQNVKIILPHCLLNPDFKNLRPLPAVVGGNTEVSQRLTDTLLKALHLAACSQGTMNNLLFGNSHFGYYETICGGTGAGEGFGGADAVHQHMTNTRITDPEIMEWRYPVRVRKFEIRKGSGGEGQWRGGDGVVREIEFLEPLELTILSQHRKERPYGLNGGMAGEAGKQYLINEAGETKMLEGIDSCQVQHGDRLIICTPGGGGYGKKNSK